ncbi:MAG: YicC family protein [Ruminococcus sp.]|nr:YicC family protein [Ruminococcus sp.]
MLSSMTSYGRAQKILNGRDILVEIRSVNHRYFDYSSRIPRVYNYIDEKLKFLMRDHVSREKIEVNVTVNSIESKDSVIHINKSAVEGYITALRDVSGDLSLEDDLKLSNLLKLPDIFNVQKLPDNEEQIWNDISEVAGETLEKFIEMRRTEGAKLKNDVIEKAASIEKMVAEVEKISPVTSENYRKKLTAKLEEILESKEIDQQRIVTEAAIFAEKIAVDEETVRLRSHISQLWTMLDSEETVGRKLDFIVQEMNHEVNTIDSKAQDLNITKIVVDMKAEIEKIREQIQNIE